MRRGAPRVPPFNFRDRRVDIDDLTGYVHSRTGILAEAYLASILLEVAGKVCLEAVSAGPQGEPTGRPHFFVRAAWSVK